VEAARNDSCGTTIVAPTHLYSPKVSRAWSLIYLSLGVTFWAHGSVVVKALCYKSKGLVFGIRSGPN
jgi:hypothetical protein